MNMRTPIYAATLAIIVGGGQAFATGNPDQALEPCINGAVSASGLFASQTEEDRYFATRDDKASRLAGD